MKVMVAVLIYAGLRRAEILWLTRQDVDLQAGLIHIRAKNIDGQVWKPKTSRNRSVPISKVLAAHLKDYTPRTGPWLFPSLDSHAQGVA